MQSVRRQRCHPLLRYQDHVYVYGGRIRFRHTGSVFERGNIVIVFFFFSRQLRRLENPYRSASKSRFVGASGVENESVRKIQFFHPFNARVPSR